MSDDVWQAIAVIGLLFAGWTLLFAARGALQPREMDPPSQARGIVLAYLTVVAFVLVLGLDVKPGAAVVAVAVGIAAGYLIAQRAGYIDNYGDVFAKGSAWYLAPVALSAAVAVYGTLNHSDSSIALGLLGGYASLGIGTGQLMFAWQACRQVELAWDVYFDSLVEPSEVVAVDELPAMIMTRAELVETCPNGHAITSGSRFCSLCGEASYCPNGHAAARSGLAFCNTCGTAMRG